jgi:hypothetical protein
VAPETVDKGAEPLVVDVTVTVDTAVTVSVLTVVVCEVVYVVSVRPATSRTCNCKLDLKHEDRKIYLLVLARSESP